MWLKITLWALWLSDVWILLFCMLGIFSCIFFIDHCYCFDFSSYKTDFHAFEWSGWKMLKSSICSGRKSAGLIFLIMTIFLHWKLVLVEYVCVHSNKHFECVERVGEMCFESLVCLCILRFLTPHISIHEALASHTTALAAKSVKQQGEIFLSNFNFCY